MIIFLEQCGSYGCYIQSLQPKDFVDHMTGTANTSSKCISDDKHKELVDESMEKHSDIWASLAKK